MQQQMAIRLSGFHLGSVEIRAPVHARGRLLLAIRRLAERRLGVYHERKRRHGDLCDDALREESAEHCESIR